MQHNVHLVPRVATTRSFEGVAAETVWPETPGRGFCYRQASGLHELDQRGVKRTLSVVLVPDV